MMNKPLKRKDVIIKRAIVIIAMITVTALITHMFDRNNMKSDNKLPTQSWGAINVYDHESKTVREYYGLLYFEPVETMGEKGVHIYTAAAKLITEKNCKDIE